MNLEQRCAKWDRDMAKWDRVGKAPRKPWGYDVFRQGGDALAADSKKNPDG